MISDDPKNILLVQLFSNGDCLYATAVARQIKTDFPNSTLTWAIAGFCSTIIENNPFVDTIRVVDDVPKSDQAAFRRFKKKIEAEKLRGEWDEIFNTTPLDDNLGLYDGTIRGMILNAYPFPVTVPLQPVLKLHGDEIRKVEAFVENHRIKKFTNVILWEFAPQSGQVALSPEMVMEIAGKISCIPSTCLILSSSIAFSSSDKIIDASVLTLRENAALTHYCSMMIGCSSGITWVSTSSAAKMLPMIQLLNANTAFLNAPSIDFKRFGISTEFLIEIINISKESVYQCVETILTRKFSEAKEKYHEEIPLQFATTRKVVYNMLCYMQFKAIATHYRLNIRRYGTKAEFLKQFSQAILLFPIKLLSNTIQKKLLKIKA